MKAIFWTFFVYLLVLRFELWGSECQSNLYHFLQVRQVMDISRTEEAIVYSLTPNNKYDIIRAIRLAKLRNLKISLLGTNHSHGGHNRLVAKNGAPQTIQLNMMKMNQIISLDANRNLVTVGPGVTWKELAVFLNGYGLAAKTEQSSNIFSVGGSVATNIHGRDVYGPLINSIESIKYLDSDGYEQIASRTKHPEIFRALVGGYGGLGVMIEITLRVGKNFIYEAKSYQALTINDYVEYLKEFGQKAEHQMHYGRVNIFGPHAFEQVSFVEWNPIDEKMVSPNWDGYKLFLGEKNRFASALIMNLMRYRPTSSIGKFVKDTLDQLVGLPKTGTRKTKNNILNNPVHFLFDQFYNKSHSVDILQEYFLPVEAMPIFFEELKKINARYNLNLLNATMRFVPKIERENDSLLSPYSNVQDQVAIVLYFNVVEKNGLNNGELIEYDGSIWTQDLIDLAHQLGGTFYWPYHRWWSADQIQNQSKEDIKKYFDLKQQVDPNNRFDSDFLRALKNSR